MRNKKVYYLSVSQSFSLAIIRQNVDEDYSLSDDDDYKLQRASPILFPSLLVCIALYLIEHYDAVIDNTMLK